MQTFATHSNCENYFKMFIENNGLIIPKTACDFANLHLSLIYLILSTYAVRGGEKERVHKNLCFAYWEGARGVHCYERMQNKKRRN